MLATRNRKRLAPPKASDSPSNTVVLSGKNEAPEDIKKYIEAKNKNYKIEFADSATALCLLAEGKVTLHINMEPAMEWQTAAADAIARSSGKRVYDYITGEELTYNKESLSNDRFVAE